MRVGGSGVEMYGFYCERTLWMAPKEKRKIDEKKIALVLIFFFQRKGGTAKVREKWKIKIV